MTASQIRRTTRTEPSVYSLRSTETKLQHGISLGGVTDPCRFAGNQGLKINNVEKSRIHELRLD